MTVPARNEGSTESGHCPALDNEILENLVQRGSHVDITICKRWAIVQEVKGSILAALLDFFVKPLFLPLGEHFRFALGQPGLHWKIRLREINRVFISAHERRQRVSVDGRRVNATKSVALGLASRFRVRL